MTQISLRADAGIIQSAVESVSADDRMWFDLHSEKRYRLRKFVCGESIAEVIATHTIVICYQQGIRFRCPVRLSPSEAASEFTQRGLQKLFERAQQSV